MNRKHLRGLLPLLLAGGALPGCGAAGTVVDVVDATAIPSGSRTVTPSGTTVTQDRPVGAFDGISIGVPGRLFVESGRAATALTIIGDERALSVITSEVRDGTLVLGLADGTDLRLDDVLQIEYRVTLGPLARFEAGGVVQAEVSGIDVPQLAVRVAGSSTLEISGVADRQDVLLSGTSRYAARNLASREAVVDLSGATHGVVRVEEALSGRATGTSVIRYLGDPQVSVSVSGAASVGPE